MDRRKKNGMLLIIEKQHGYFETRNETCKIIASDNNDDDNDDDGDGGAGADDDDDDNDDNNNNNKRKCNHIHTHPYLQTREIKSKL